MTTLRQGKETLLTLLEAFVYDPLLDWINNETGIIASFYGGGGTDKNKNSSAFANQSEANENKIQMQQKNEKEKRKNMEKKMTHRLYAIRLIENRSLMQKNYDSLIKIISTMESCINSIGDSMEKRIEREKTIRLHEQAKIYLDESLTLHGENNKATKNTNQHPVYTLHDRYAEYLHFNNNSKTICSLIDAQVEYYEKLSLGHIDSIEFVTYFSELLNTLTKDKEKTSILILDVVTLFVKKLENRSRNLSSSSTSSTYAINTENIINVLDNLTLEASMSVISDDKHLFSEPCMITNDFLQSIGQNNYIIQCEAIYKDIEQAKLNRNQLLEKILDLFYKCSCVMSWLPHNYYKESKHLQLLEWLKTLRNNYDLEIFVDVSLKYSQQYNLKFQTNVYNKCQELYETPHTEYIEQNISTINKKEMSFKSEIESIENILVGLNLRKSSITSHNKAILSELALAGVVDVNLTCLNDESLLKIKHDLIEANLFVFIESQVNDSAHGNISLSSQLFESFNLVISHFLNDGLQKWILMENASLNAKEHLNTLKSIDGDWYLEEMLSLINNCTHLTKLTRKIYSKYNGLYSFSRVDVPLDKCLDICDTLANLFAGLKEILFDYEKVLFEKLVKTTYTHYDEAIQVLNELNSIEVAEFFKLISSFEENFKIESILNDSRYISKLNVIKSKYAQILANKTNKLCMSVLNEMEKVFSKVDIELEKCIKFCQVLFNKQCPWATSAYFNLTRNLVYLLDDQAFLFYKNIFLVKKIEVMQICISLSDKYFQFSFGTNDIFEFRHDNIESSLKTYISEFVVQMLVGIPTIILSSVLNCLKNNELIQINSSMNQNDMFNYLLNQNIINEYHFNALNQIITNYDSTWSTMDVLLRIEASKSYFETHLNTTLCIQAAFEWFNDPYLTEGRIKNQHFINSQRQTILDQLDIFFSSLNSFNTQLNLNLDKINTCEQNILKRLEWASGSNPSLNETMKSFDILRKKRNNNLTKENVLASKLISFIEMWTNFELYRSISSAPTKVLLESQNNFENIVKSIETADLLNKENLHKITDVENNLMSFQSFASKKPLTNAIIQEYYRLLFEDLTQMKRIKQKDEKDCATKMDELLSCMTELKSVLNQHNKVMNDIKPLLKAMSKEENTKLQDYTKTYQLFSENCNALIRHLSSEDAIKRNQKEINLNISILKEVIPK